MDIRKYLKEFLSDRRVIEINQYYGRLNLFILTFRPSKTAHAYKNLRKDTTSLLALLRKQSQKLKDKISRKYNC